MIEDVVDKYKAKSAKPIYITTLFGATSALADEEYLKEAISNIVDNATKYSKEEINIQISTSENDRNVYIKIYDEGIGIARSEMKQSSTALSVLLSTKETPGRPVAASVSA